MKNLKQFKNVDVFAVLQNITDKNTEQYRDDFEDDKSYIAKQATSLSKRNKTLLWVSTPYGTDCLLEWDVFIRDTVSCSAWCYYKEQAYAHTLAYAIELTGVKDGKIIGNLYELDYDQHYERVKKNAVVAGMTAVIYEHGARIFPSEEEFPEHFDVGLGYLKRIETLPRRPEQLRFLLQEEKRLRNELPLGNLEEYIAALCGGQ